MDFGYYVHTRIFPRESCVIQTTILINSGDRRLLSHPSWSCIRVCASCLIFHLIWIGDLWNPQNHFENDPNKNFSKRVQENAHVALWKYWTEIKIKPIFLVAHGHLFWAFGINAQIFALERYFYIYEIWSKNYANYKRALE